MIIDFKEIVGRNFDLLGLDEESFILDYNDPELYDDLPEGWTVEARDQSWEMILSKEKIINNVILYPKEGMFPLFNLAYNCTAHYIRNRFGSPLTSGNGTSYANCNEGTYDIYEIEELLYRFEYEEPLKKLLTIVIMNKSQQMLPADARTSRG